MRIALLISGRGSTAKAIINACKSPFPKGSTATRRGGILKGITPACVIASHANAGGIESIAATGFPKEKIYVVSLKSLTASGPLPLGKGEFGEAILKTCKENKVDFIGQYGWLVKTPKNVIEAYPNMMVNQHNGPLPEFGGDGMYGMRVHCARLLFARRVNRDFWTEGVAQRVSVEFDGGVVLKVGRVPIMNDDTPETLAARLLPIEHQVQIAMLQDFVNGTVKEIKREVLLVRPGEEQILAECKKEAILRYPKG